MSRGWMHREWWTKGHQLGTNGTNPEGGRREWNMSMGHGPDPEGLLSTVGAWVFMLSKMGDGE